MNEEPVNDESSMGADSHSDHRMLVESSTDLELANKQASEQPTIQVTNLYRSFPGVNAVQGISFSVQSGQVVGFIGANGAGKTTTLRILATLDYPTYGEAYICGFNTTTHPAEVRRRIGWMPDHYGVYKHMTVLEYLDFFSRSLGFSGQDRIDRIAEILEFTDLIQFPDRFVNTLSKGMGQRLCLGRALIHDPDVLILDEPAAGLDPKARVELKHLIRILADEGKTILISSHILSELDEMCDTLLFIDQGKIIHYGSTEALRRGNSGTSLIEVKLAKAADEALREWCLLMPNVNYRGSIKDGAQIEVDSTDPNVISTTLKRMITSDLPVVDFHLIERKLEDAFVDILDHGSYPQIAIPEGQAEAKRTQPPALPASTIEAASSETSPSSKDDSQPA